MPNINRSDGTVIAWSGEIQGPESILNPMGTSTGWSEFTTTLAVDGEIREIVIRIQDSEMDTLGLKRTPDRDQIARECVARFVEKHCGDSKCKIPEDKEHFTLSDLTSLRESIPQAQTKLICTVELPVAGEIAPQSHQIEVFDPSNAITMLQNRLPKNPAFKWELARVVQAIAKALG
ncbi:MAG TPA: hypothetical protein VGJ33_00570 [Candidatus Angelobacter sp.]